jgi:hypothetical protein
LRRLALVLAATAAAGCADGREGGAPDAGGVAADVADRPAYAPSIDADSAIFDPSLGPGTVLRAGPANAEQVADPTSAPVVAADGPQVAIHDGFFRTAPCGGPLGANAVLLSDTIVVRVVSQPPADTAACEGEGEATAYALLVGQFEPGDYVVRLIHDGDRARPPLDTVYPPVTLEPREP